MRGSAPSPDDPAYLIFFEDFDMRPEVFKGAGAERAARLRFNAVLSNWTAHLFARVDDGKRPTATKRCEQHDWTSISGHEFCAVCLVPRK
jgi:hypothetical protein